MSLMFISDDMTHDFSFFFTALLEAHLYAQRRLGNNGIKHAAVRSDGAAGHFFWMTGYAAMSAASNMSDLKESCHGKGKMDNEGRVIKCGETDAVLAGSTIKDAGQ